MSNKKEESGPRLSSVIFLGIISFALGKLLAVISMVSQPAMILGKEPEPESLKPGTVWYVRGERAGRTAWQAKEDAWKAGSVDRLTLTEAELNQWSQERLKPERAVIPQQGASWKDRIKVNVTPVNFHFVDDRLQLTTELSFADLFVGKTCLYAVVGRFESTADGIRFVPERGTLGTAPLGSVPFYREWLYGFFRDYFAAGADLAWLEDDFGELQSVEVADGQLVLKRGA